MLSHILLILTASLGRGISAPSSAHATDICVFYWTLPGCPLAAVLGVDVFGTYDWEALCQEYPDFIEKQICSGFDEVVGEAVVSDGDAIDADDVVPVVSSDLSREEIELEALENLLYNFNLDQHPNSFGQSENAENQQSQSEDAGNQKGQSEHQQRFGFISRPEEVSFKVSRPRGSLGDFVVTRN